MEELKKATQSLIVPILRQTEPLYVKDGYSNQLETAFEALTKRLTAVTALSKQISAKQVTRADQENKKQLINSVKGATGIDVRGLVQSEDLTDIVNSKISENTSLIRSIPEEFLKKVEGVVYRSTVEGKTSGSIIKELQKVYKSTENRAKLIARDQTSKLNAALNKERQERLGIETYIWRDAGDERTRESHDVLNGMLCRWDDPTVYSDDDGKTWKKRSSIGGFIGHPGEDIQCRCNAQPVIEID